ncbi:MAG: AAA family ATPase [Clostridiales bacterium]|nr:AAA family ATPase [Clostridiales bacterium]
MAVYIEKLSIDGFRGIHKLAIDRTNHVNIVVGDNNCGKTSILEAILLLRNPMDFANVLRIARLRNIPFSAGGAPSIYENYIGLFPKDEAKLAIGVNALCKNAFSTYCLSGEQKKIMLDPEDLVKRLPLAQRKRALHEYGSAPVETDAFAGEIQYDFGEYKGKFEVDINAYSSVSGREVDMGDFLDMVYLAPFNHVIGNVFNTIIRNDSYKEICLQVLRMFDPDIADLLILRNESNDRPVEYVKHIKLGNMPLSTYGDGIKKVLSIANGIAQAAGGVLLIDEVDTAIHSQYYNDIFRFIAKACMQFEVQLFLTTHSKEAVDGFLGTQDYDTQNEYDDIQVITLKKEIGDRKTYSRVLHGRKVFANREQFNFEVRL